MNPPIIIIPVFNAFNESKVCLNSIVRHSPGAEVIVIDDASNDGLFESWIGKEIKNLLDLTVLRNDKNMGFPFSANLGFASSGDRDVILLNSDTIVTANWMDKLQEAAYSSDNVATVTPFTNNGTICSIPNFCQSNEIPSGINLDEWADLIESSSEHIYPEIPTSVGFCMYIKRTALRVTSGFDVNTFGRGYGEENDFSMRIRKAGLRDILDDATFIYHKSASSFGSDGANLQSENLKKLEARYPHYSSLISRFCIDDPIAPLRERVLLRFLIEKSSNKPHLLHILHNGPFKSYGETLGGTERHVQSLIRGINQVIHVSLVPDRSFLRLTFHDPDFDLSYLFKREALVALLGEDFFPLIHLHHLNGFDRDLALNTLSKRSGVFSSIHDYSLICPRTHLLTPKATHCNLHECKSSCGYNDDYISNYRASSLELIKQSNKTFVFSESSRKYLSAVFQDSAHTEFVPHGSSDPSFLNVNLNSTEPLKILLLGRVVLHKGEPILKKLFSIKEINSRPIEWHILGDDTRSLGADNVFVHGFYEEDSLAGLVNNIKPHLYLSLSLCPETYSLTLDEVLSFGIPAIVGPLGAPRERIEAFGAGWVLNELSFEAAHRLLVVLSANPKLIIDMHKQILKAKLYRRDDAISIYALHYNASFQNSFSPDLFLEFITAHAIRKLDSPSIFMHYIKKSLHYFMHSLETLKIKRFLQELLRKHSSPKFYNWLKQRSNYS